MSRSLSLAVLVLMVGCNLDWKDDAADVDASTPEAGMTDDSGAPEPGSDAGPDTDAMVGSGFEVSSVSPADGSTLDDVEGVITVTFSDPVDADTVTATSWRVLRDGRALPGMRRVTGRTATFEAAAAWVLGATYQLELGAAIKDTQGRSLEAASFDFTVRDGVWADPLRLNECWGESNLAVAPNGRAAAVWTKNGMSGVDVWSSRFTPDGGWTDPTQIAAGGGGSPINASPLVALNDEGPVVSVWYWYDGVYTASYLDNYWTTREPVNGGAYYPDLALSPSGTAFVMLSASGVMSSLKVHHFTPGGDAYPSDTVAPELPTNSSSLHGKVAMLGEVPIAVWDQYNEGKKGIWAKQGAKLAELASDEGAVASVPQVTTDPVAGSAVVTWQQFDETWSNVWASRTVANANFGAAKRLSDDTSNATHPSIALDERGRGLAVWEQVDGTGISIKAASFDPQTGWAPPVLVSEGEGGKAQQPVVALERGGNGLVVWTEADPTDDTLVDAWVARYIAGVGFVEGERKVLSTTRRVKLGLYNGGTAPTPGRPSVGIDTQGRAIAAWIEDGSIWLARAE